MVRSENQVGRNVEDLEVLVHLAHEFFVTLGF